MKDVLRCLDAAFDVLSVDDAGEQGALWIFSPKAFAGYAAQHDQILDAAKTFATAAAEVLAIDLSLSRYMFSNRRPIDPRLAPEGWFAEDVQERGETEPRFNSAHLSAGRQCTGFLPARWAPLDEDELVESSAASKNKPPGRKYKLVYKEAEQGRKQGAEPGFTYKRQKGGAPQNPDLMPRTDGSRKPRTWARTAKVGSAKQALGVRILLQEWNVGEDPDDYVFKPIFAPLSSVKDNNLNTADPQGTQSHAAPPAPSAWPRSQGAPSVPRPLDLRNKTKVAPTLIPSSQLVGPASQGRPGLTLTSQRQAQSLGDWGLAVGTENELPPMSNTQVLPGPFGGRVPVKKKRAGF